MYRVTFDTNIFISALCCPKGICAQLLRDDLINHYALYTSETIIEELLNVGIRKNFRKYFATKELKIFIEILEDEAIVVTKDEIDLVKVYSSLANSYDLHIVKAFVASDSDCLVTGNKKHFMLAKEKLLSPREFLRILEQS